MTRATPPSSRCRQRPITGLILLITLGVIVSGMAYSLWWPAVVRHQSLYWAVPGDFWGTVRAAHWIGWGSLSYIYSSQTGLVTLPGFHLLFTPFVLLSSALHLSETAPGFLPVPKPTAWLLLGPVSLACMAVPLFGFDSLARNLGISHSKRKVLVVAEAAALWQVVAFWGHPEDILALGLVALGLAQAQNERFTAAGWFLGAAIGMQLYVILLVPLFLGLVGLRRAPLLIARAAIIPSFLLIAVVVPNPHATLHALLDQPNFPAIDHATPWVLIAPSLGHGAVAAGPGRIIAFVLAAALGFLASFLRDNRAMIVALAALALVARCVFESVMDPYYVAPVLALALVILGTVQWWRWPLAIAAGAAVTVTTYFHTGVWVYWGEMVGLLAALFGFCWPSRISTGAEQHPEHLKMPTEPCSLESLGSRLDISAPIAVPAELLPAHLSGSLTGTVDLSG